MKSPEAATLQIKRAYEDEHLTPEEIAEDLGWDVIAVKSALIGNSSAYRKACNAEPPDESVLNFSDEELLSANRVIVECAQGACLPSGDPDWRVRLNAAQYIRDDKKGRKEVRNAIANTTNNVMIVSDALRSAREGANKLRESFAGMKSVGV
jgi:hypothetical protein